MKQLLNNMNTIFTYKELNNPSFFQKLFKLKLPQNFVLEINNLLNKNQILEVSKTDISEIENKYGSKIIVENYAGLLDLYSTYLNHCLIDKALSDNDLTELNHLKEILSISEKDVIELQNNITVEIYKDCLKDIISDGKIENSEQDFLNKLQNDLHLSDDIANEVSEQVRGQFVKDFFIKLVYDGRLSPDEEVQLSLVSKNLDVSLEIDDNLQSVLNRYKFNWVIENGEIPEIDVGISLEKNEKCYFQTNCDWLEMRTITKRINYSGTTANIKIMKGVSYRIGSIKPQNISSENLTKIDSGTMYLTSKRILFVGKLKNLNIKIEKILSFTLYSNGVELSKDSGRSPFIKFTDNLDIFSLMMSRLLNE